MNFFGRGDCLRSVIRVGTMGRHVFLAFLIGGSLLLAVGCGNGHKAESLPPLPPRTLGEIVGTIEANARRMDRALWSTSVAVTARVTDRDGRFHIYNLDGSLLFQPPRNLRLDLRPGMGDQVMQLGSNAEEYWIWIEPEIHTMWWGRYDYVGRPCAKTVAVRPEQLTAVLGLGGLPKPDEDLIGPARRYGEEYDVLYYLRPWPVNEETPADDTSPNEDAATSSETNEGYWLEREYWVDRSAPYLVRAVHFRDEMGRVETLATLDDYVPAWENGPWVPRKIRIEWPLRQGRFTMIVGGYKGQPKEKINARAFERTMKEKLPAGITEIIQVDADCAPVIYWLDPESEGSSPAIMLPSTRPAMPSTQPMP